MMMPVSYSTVVEEARSGRGEDRIATMVLSDRTVIMVADGCGGTAMGVDAAIFACNALEKARTNAMPDVWSEWLMKLDRAMFESGSCGLAAVVVLEVRQDGTISGASVGDCEAWVFGAGAPVSLTDNQIRKPLIGGGDAMPVDFGAHLSKRTIVIGSDGLWKYANRQRIAEAAARRPLETAASALVNCVRLRSGALQDDVAIVVCEVAQ